MLEKSEFENPNVDAATVDFNHVPDCIWLECIPHRSDSSRISAESWLNGEYNAPCGVFTGCLARLKYQVPNMPYHPAKFRHVHPVFTQVGMNMRDFTQFGSI